jgi:hypothetical protein
MVSFGLKPSVVQCIRSFTRRDEIPKTSHGRMCRGVHRFRFDSFEKRINRCRDSHQKASTNCHQQSCGKTQMIHLVATLLVFPALREGPVSKCSEPSARETALDKCIAVSTLDPTRASANDTGMHLLFLTATRLHDVQFLQLHPPTEMQRRGLLLQRTVRRLPEGDVHDWLLHCAALG